MVVVNIIFFAKYNKKYRQGLKTYRNLTAQIDNPPVSLIHSVDPQSKSFTVFLYHEHQGLLPTLDPLVKSGMPVDCPSLSSDYSLIERHLSVLNSKLSHKHVNLIVSPPLSPILLIVIIIVHWRAPKRLGYLGLGMRVRNFWEESVE